MKTAINEFQGQLSDYFRQLILAAAYLNIGGREISGAPADVSVQLVLDKDITTEPLLLRALLPFSRSVAEGILELYQNKMIASWSDLLADLFAHFVNMHFRGSRKFLELKKRTVRIDFSLDADLLEQVGAGLITDFSFQKYGERVKIINSLLNPYGRHEAELSTISRHVLIRNSVQHHGSRLYRDMLRELGESKLLVLDANADAKELNVNDQIILSLPELDALKRGLFRVSNEWRVNCG